MYSHIKEHYHVRYAYNKMNNTFASSRHRVLKALQTIYYYNSNVHQRIMATTKQYNDDAKQSKTIKQCLIYMHRIAISCYGDEICRHRHVNKLARLQQTMCHVIVALTIYTDHAKLDRGLMATSLMAKFMLIA